MNDVIETMVSRRSCRKFTRQQLTEDQLQAVLTAGRYAPTGGNCQLTHFLVIQDGAVLSELSARVQSAFARMELTEDLYASIRNSIQASRLGTYHYDYQAPTLIVVASRAGYPNAMADCACAIENMMVAATSLGLGSCWINQLRWLDGNEGIHRYLETLGLGAEETVCGAVALGEPQEEAKPPRPRTGMTVTYVR